MKICTGFAAYEYFLYFPNPFAAPQKSNGPSLRYIEATVYSDRTCTNTEGPSKSCVRNINKTSY